MVQRGEGERKGKSMEDGNATPVTVSQGSEQGRITLPCVQWHGMCKIRV
jgi:hypothetical protein